MTRWLNGLVGRAAMSGFITLKALATPVALGACAVAFDRERRVLLVRHSYQPGWMLPGGGVGRAEPPVEAVMRELREEVGLLRSQPPEFSGLYTRRAGWATNVVAVFTISDVEIDFRPNLEIVEVMFADSRNLPPETTPPTARRIREVVEDLPRPPFW